MAAAFPTQIPSRHRSRLRVVLLIAGVLSWVAPALAQTVFRFTGGAGRVGEALPPPGQPGGAPLNIHGRFFLPEDLDLCNASLTIDHLLSDESLGELLRGIDGTPVLPLTLESPQCSSSGDAVFRTPDSARPSFRVAVRQRAAGIFDFHIKVTRATIPTAPAACSGGETSADLATSFVLDEGTGSTVVATIESWRCRGRALRAARADSAPTPTPPPGATPTPSPAPGPTGVPTPTPEPTPDRGIEIDFTGKATRIDQLGVPVQAAEIRMAGKFCGAVIADLTLVSITFDSVLGEDGGAFELLEGVPLTLAPVGLTAEGVAFRCQVAGPSCWMELKQTVACSLPGGGSGVRYEYSLKIDRSQDERRVPITYTAAPSCASGDNVDLTTDFTIADSATLQTRSEHTWRCSGSDETVSQIRTD